MGVEYWVALETDNEQWNKVPPARTLKTVGRNLSTCCVHSGFSKALECSGIALHTLSCCNFLVLRFMFNTLRILKVDYHLNLTGVAADTSRIDLLYLPSMVWKVSCALPSGVLSFDRTVNCAASHTAHCQSTTSVFNRARGTTPGPLPSALLRQSRFSNLWQLWYSRSSQGSLLWLEEIKDRHTVHSTSVYHQCIIL